MRRLDAIPADTANAAVPNAQILENLKEAYGADASGMTFWEIARSHRSDGVFDEGFTEFLNDQIEAAPEVDNRCASGQLVMLQCTCAPFVKQSVDADEMATAGSLLPYAQGIAAKSAGQAIQPLASASSTI